MSHKQFSHYLLSNHYTAKFDFAHSGGVILDRYGEAVECFSYTLAGEGLNTEPTNIKIWMPDHF